MKIGLFYSYGPHFLKAVNFLIEKYPDDEIIVFIPEQFPTYYFEKLPIKPIVLPWNGQHFKIYQLTFVFSKIIKLIRAQQLDIFVILFESFRLITLSKFSGAQQTYIYSIHKKYEPISQGIFENLFKTFSKRVKGFYLYLYILFHVYFCKGRRAKPFSKY